MKQSNEKIRRRCWMLFALALGVTAFIFFLSLKDKEQSGALSGGIVQWLKPLLDPYNRVSEEAFHHYLRKTAHFTEFAVLGLCWSSYSVQLGKLKGRRYITLPLLLTLGTAVSDEYIQFFANRGSAVTDVVLDYTGAVFGFAIIYLWNLRMCRRGTEKETSL